MFDRPQIVASIDDLLAQEKSGRELAIGARRAHDDGERSAVQPDFERFFRRRAIRVRAPLSGPDPNDLDVAQRYNGWHAGGLVVRYYVHD